MASRDGNGWVRCELGHRHWGRFGAAGAAAQAGGNAIKIDNDDLAGVVTGPKGPEAGVWVIAETSDLPTKFAKIVVTDNAGRYLVPPGVSSVQALRLADGTRTPVAVRAGVTAVLPASDGTCGHGPVLELTRPGGTRTAADLSGLVPPPASGDGRTRTRGTGSATSRRS